MFYDPSNLEVMYWNCHSVAIQSVEALGYDTASEADGWRVDAKHPNAPYLIS